MMGLYRRRIEETSQDCGIPGEKILRFIEEEWIIPSEGETPLLDEEDVARIRLIWDLSERFGVNDEGIPIILDLVDQLNRLHLEIEKLRQREDRDGT